MKGLPEVELAADADALGLDGAVALSGDPVETVLLQARVELALEARRALHDDQAIAIRDRIAELF